MALSDDQRLSRALAKTNEAIRLVIESRLNSGILSEMDIALMEKATVLTEQSDAIALGVDRGAGRKE